MDVREVTGGVHVGVRVRPRSSPGIERGSGGLVIGVRATPEAGRATEEARRMLATVLGVSAGAVILQRGSRSRQKVFAVDGLSLGEALRRLRSALP
ncbi:MAG TPA: DUF167 domain-containing protein [Actinomycetota bacterium]|nr:DUF167 domain-containing protein [Actinomycetota bacterium]